MYGNRKASVKIFRPAYALAAIIILSLLSGCSGPLQVAYKPSKEPYRLKLKEQPSVRVDAFQDSRRPPGERTIGEIDAVVSDMNSRKLTLSQDVAAIVTSAFKQELSNAGFKVQDAGPADYVMSGEVRQFSLDIKDRDKVAIEVSSSLTEARTGKVLWSGTEAEKNDRFAGVLGNSRSTISNYISASLSKVVRNTVNEAGEAIASQAGRPAIVPQGGDAQTAPPAQSGPGRAVISSEPARSKVYVNEVYYGLTPITVELDPGIYNITVKHQGYKDVSEKVSIRAGQPTEMELSLEKQ